MVFRSDPGQLASDPMPAIRYHVALEDEDLESGFDALRREIGVPESHPPEVWAEAEAAAARGPTLPPGADRTWEDRRDLTLVAIDPAGARDLDQAFGAERRGDGYRVHYAIADVAAFVTPGSALEADSLERGVTLYAPDRRMSLHPEPINEDAASLLPGRDRPAVLWQIDLDDIGELAEVTVGRATVRVTEAMSYREAQSEIDAADPRPCLELLREVGRLREALEVRRGAVSLKLPGQEVERDEHGHLQLTYDENLPVEGWNAQISLLTGIAAARLMLDAGVGLLRTLPPPDIETVGALRRTARGLGIDWPDDQSYADRVRTLDPNDPQEVALISRAARGLRGAGYAAFLDASEIPEYPNHSAIASTYAHVTAPLRRVCDRYVNEVILALCAGDEPPDWASSMLPELPSIMGRTRQRETALERGAVDFMEVMMLEPSVGATFDAVVVNHRRDKAVILVHDPAVIAEITPKPMLGQEITVRLQRVDIEARRVHFERVD